MLATQRNGTRTASLIDVRSPRQVQPSRGSEICVIGTPLSRVELMNEIDKVPFLTYNALVPMLHPTAASVAAEE
jgi:hypothetical protein